MRGIIILIILLLTEIYAFQAVKTAVRSKTVLIIYLVISILILTYLLYFFLTFDRGSGQTKQSLYTIGLFLIVFLPKLMITVFLLGEDIFRLLKGVFYFFTPDGSHSSFLPERRRFVSQIALGIAAVPFFSFLYGMTLGKYNFKIFKKTLFFKDLPESFDGLTITQISDIHVGSFDSEHKIEEAIQLINQQDSDLLLFTGDIVNTHASEMDPWLDVFKKIHNPKLGKYSVLGNHDYGEYYKWDSEEDKKNNFENIIDIHNKIGFRLLRNESVEVHKNSESIHIVGVENWGRHFKKKGDLKKASEGIEKDDFKILMSHDPSHWNSEVQHDDKHFHLTLSGHTHGLQFGIEVPGWIKWSPVQYIYKQWAGLYENAGRYLYVNRGFGFHAYSGRVGIMPEITVIQLKKA